MIKKGEKGGQVTIFIIIAILIVALGILIYLYWPKIFSNVSPETTNPSAYIQDCMQQKIEDTVNNLSLQGGSVNPGFYYSYYNGKGVDNIEYLCYINQYYRPCVVQQPMLLEHIQSEILKEIKNSTITCFNSMNESYVNKGYETNMTPGNTTVELLPEKIVTTFGYKLDLTKGETQKYENFKIVLDNNLYELVGIANSIIAWETEYGDAEITTYMDYYHDLKVEKKKQVDETTVYILTDTTRDNKFEFATRSYAFPPGIAP
jgi:hypothetical protein